MLCLVGFVGDCDAWRGRESINSTRASSNECCLDVFHVLQDLHHPAMRGRHWQMLMKTTGKHFVMDEKFCLGDLLALELHNYVDACRYMVVVLMHVSSDLCM